MFVSVLVLGLFGILYYRRILLFHISLFLFKTYVYLAYKISYILPMYIFIKMYEHKKYDVDFSVHEYLYNYNGRFYKFKMVESNDYNINNYFDKLNVRQCYDIYHIYISNENGEYIKDITYEIRQFMHLRNIIEWKYILVHLGIDNEHSLIYHKDWDTSSEQNVLYIKNIYDEKFTFV